MERFAREVRRYLNSRDFSKATLNIYWRVIRQFIIKVRPDEDEWVARAIRWKRNLKISPSSVALYVVIVRMFLRWCVKRGLVDTNPMENMKVKWHELTPRQALAPEEAQLLLSAAKNDTGAFSRRNHAIISLMLHTGLRIGSVVSLRIQDFEKAKKRVILKYLSKGHRNRDSFVVVPYKVMKLIDRYLRFHHRDFGDIGPIWFDARGKAMTDAALRQMIVRYLKAIGLKREGICVHSLRHTAASMAIAAGADVRAVKDMLGHSKIETTERYIHSIRRVEDAAEARIDYGGGR